jgi:hypothetical protein
MIYEMHRLSQAKHMKPINVRYVKYGMSNSRTVYVPHSPSQLDSFRLSGQLCLRVSATEMYLTAPLERSLHFPTLPPLFCPPSSSTTNVITRVALELTFSYLNLMKSVGFQV